jgi:integrase
MSAYYGKLTAAKIAKAARDIGDGNGLWLQIRGDSRYWMFRWKDRQTGKDRNVGLGPLRVYDIQDARAWAVECQKLLWAKRDPKAERDDAREKEAHALGLVRTVDQVIDEFIDQMVNLPKRSRHTKDQATYFLGLVRKTIGSLPIAKIDTKMILETAGLAKMWKENNPSGKMLLSVLSRLFYFAKTNGYYKGHNPAQWKGHLQFRLAPSRDLHRSARRPSVPWQEIPRFMELLRNRTDKRGHKKPPAREYYKFSKEERDLKAAQQREWREKHDKNKGWGRTTVSWWLEFIILTGARVDEVRMATWNEIDKNNRIWACPPEHHKIGNQTGEPIFRPITDAMMTVLDEMQRRFPDTKPDALIFPNVLRGKIVPFNEGAPYDFIKHVLKWPGTTVHGFRRTLKEWARQRGAPGWADLVEFQLGHDVGTRTDKAYAEYTMLDQRKPVMDAWSQYCSQPPREPNKGTNIENLTEYRRKA